MSNNGPTSAACGNIAMPSASDSNTFLPGNSRRAMAYAANIAMITEITVAMIAMPIELISARVNSGLLKITLKLSRVNVLGRNVGLPDTMSDGGLKARLIIHSIGTKL